MTEQPDEKGEKDEKGDEPKRKQRYLSGLQSSGTLHLGNYFGAIRQHLDLQVEGESFYFLANYHALTTLHDREAVARNTFEAAATYLALGLDPSTALLYRQSDVPEVCELTWLLLTATPMGELERAVSYKDKVAKNIAASAGLFTYPVLMAADILGYDSTTVPVGKDQVQHLEMAREIARSFNHQYGEKVFLEPEARLGTAPIVPGIDGAKMSKSYGNSIPIFATGKPLKKLVGKIVTDSKSMGDPLDPETCNVFALYALFADEAEKAEMADKYRVGAVGYGDAKKALIEKIEATFGDARARYEHLNAHPDEVEDVLRTCGTRARAICREVTDRARAACGVA